MVAKTEVNDDKDVDAVWMASMEENVQAWLADFGDGDFEQWNEQESAGEGWEDDLFSYETDTDSLPNLITGLGDMHVELPNGKSTSQILLKDVLYVQSMGATLISISKIAGAGFKTVFHKDLLKIFGPRDSVLGCITVQNSLYCMEHEPHEVAASATTDTMTIEELHWVMGHISLEVARKLVEDGLDEGVKLGESSSIQSCDSCEYTKAHRKPIWKE
jgi:hypothetical protein